jgi:signal transduction histidine kinase
LLDLARSETGRLTVVKAPEPVTPLVRETFEANRHRADALAVRLSMTKVDSRLLALVDRDRVLQVLGNLVGNALKFTPSGGSVTLGAEPRGDEVHFFVRDTGVGIAQEDLSHLFDPWWQAPGAEKRGLGLGLAIVKSLVEAHGGQVWINSKPEVGSEVNFTVPRFVSNIVQNGEQQAPSDQPVTELR